MVPSPHFDGDMPMWHHSKCILKAGLLSDIQLLKGFDSLRWDDQQKVKKALGFDADVSGGAAAAGAAPASGKKSAAKKSAAVVEDYGEVKYAGGKRKCDTCGNIFKSRMMRVIVSEDGSTYHADEECWEIPKKVGMDSLMGVEKLEEEDREVIQALIEAANPETASAPAPVVESEEVKAARELSEKLWKAKDTLKSQYSGWELKAILKHNDQEWQGLGPSELVDRVADGQVKGALPKCSECSGPLRPASGQKVKCHGHISAWSRCTFEADEATIKRGKWKNPAAATIAKLVDVVKEEQASTKNAFHDGPTDTNVPPHDAFKGCVFVTIGTWKEIDDDSTKIEQGGGTIASSFTAKVTHVLAEFEEVNDTSAKRPPVKKTKSLASGLPILDPRIIRYCTVQKKTLKTLDNLDDFLTYAGGKAIKPIDSKVQPVERKKKRKRLVVPPIDKDCELREDYQIYVANNAVYAITLNMTDLSVGDRGKNSLYVMQALQHKTKKTRFAMFIKWGRIGATLNYKIDDYTSPGPLVKFFEEKFFQMTSNHFESYMNNEFEKKPKGYFPVDLEGEDDEEEDSDEEMDGDGKPLKKKSVEEVLKERRKAVGEAVKKVGEKLDPRVAELIQLIFNKEAIVKQMEDMKIDTKKMPLGQISRRTLRDGLEILEKIESLIKESGYSKAKLEDLCNRFYTFVPHDFGMSRPPIIDSAEKLQTKYDLIDTLMDIEVAARILEKESDEEDPLMKKYKELGNRIEALDRDTDEFKRLETYVKNTQGSVKLKVLDIYRVARNGEADNFAKHSHLDYRKLLFHGSSVAVFPAILSGGIKIMPHSGGRVGRGNYSADMVDKSQGYCGKHGKLGLILLNEVALGKVNRIYADNSRLVAAPEGHHSVLACGQIHPDPKLDYIDTTLSPSGHPVIIPQGTKANQPDAKNSSFLHNEYLVYDATQVHMRYLLRLEWPY
jgi:poly [ADP-ribose] polymerase